MDTRVLIQSAWKYCGAFSPPPVMLHIKFDQDWPTALSFGLNGGFCCHGHQSFDKSASKSYAAFPPPQWCYRKIWSRLANWLQRYSSSKVWNFRYSRTSNSKVNSLIRSEIKRIRAFKPVLVTSNFDDDSIKNEWASMETAFSHFKSMGNCLDAQGT